MGGRTGGKGEVRKEKGRKGRVGGRKRKRGKQISKTSATENREGIPKSDDTMYLKDSLPQGNSFPEQLSPEYLSY